MCSVIMISNQTNTSRARGRSCITYDYLQGGNLEGLAYYVEAPGLWAIPIQNLRGTGC